MPGAAKHTLKLYPDLPHSFSTLWDLCTIWKGDKGHPSSQLTSSLCGLETPFPLALPYWPASIVHRDPCDLAFPDLSLFRQLYGGSLRLQSKHLRGCINGSASLVIEQQQGPAAAPILQKSALPGESGHLRTQRWLLPILLIVCINNASLRKLGATFQDWLCIC